MQRNPTRKRSYVKTNNIAASGTFRKKSPNSKNTAINVIGKPLHNSHEDISPVQNIKEESHNQKSLRHEFISLFSEPVNENGLSNDDLKANFGEEKYFQLVPIINDLTQESRLSMCKKGSQLVYKLVKEELAEKFSGLDNSARLVYQVIEGAGNLGVWTKDIRTKTNIQQQALTKIFKSLESRKLIKSVKSVMAKSKKMYMLYDITPAKEVTGGPWYTEMEFDHEFIAELRSFIIMVIRRYKDRGITVQDMADKMKLANVSRVPLSLSDVVQLMQTLAFDYMIEPKGTNDNGETIFIEAKPITSICDFSWWEALCDDFHFRDIVFGDGIRLKAHEPHFQTA